MAENRIDPNQADLEQLQQLPGIGAGLAQGIVDHRPYGSAEELLMVPGLGSGTLQRIRARLTFETAGQASAGEAAEVGEPEPAEAEPGGAQPPLEPAQTPEGAKARAGRPSADKPTTGSALALRSPTPPQRTSLWTVLAVGAASVLCSVSLSLLVLLGINGTLDYGRHAAVRQASSQVGRLEAELSQATSELNAVRRRLEVIEGVGGRMTEVESRVDQLQQQLERATGSLQDIRAQLEQVQQRTERIEQFEAFLNGLQQLLDRVVPEPEGQ